MSWDRTTPARLALIASLPAASNPPPRARVIGRVVGIDLSNNTLLLEDQGHGLLVDITNVRGSNLAVFVPKLKDLVMVMGTLDFIQKDIMVPSITVGQVDPHVSTEHVMSAFMIQPCEQIDLERWREAVKVVSGTMPEKGTVVSQTL